MTEYAPIGYQGAAQHTCTAACDGFHPPGPCPGDFPGHLRKAWDEWLRDHGRGNPDDLEEAFKDGFSAGAAYIEFAKGPAFGG